MTETANQTEAAVASVVDSAADEVLEYATEGAAGTSLSLSDLTVSDSILTQFLADTGTAATDVDCINEIIEEIDPDEFIDSNLSVALEVADDEDGSELIDSGCAEEQCQATLLPALRGTLVDNSEATDSQQSDSLVDLDAEDVIAVVSNDISETTEMVLDDAVAHKCTENNSELVKSPESQIFSSSSHDAAVITGSIAESFSMQQLQPNLTDVIDVDRSSLSMTDGKNTCPMGGYVNNDVSVDDVHSSSLLVHHSSEAENLDMHLLSKDGDLLISDNESDAPIANSVKGTLLPKDGDLLNHGNQSDAPVTSNMKGTLADKDRNIFEIFGVPDNMEQEGGLLESSSMDPRVDTAESSRPSHTSDLVEHVDDVHSLSSLDHCSSEAENAGIRLLPDDDNLSTPSNDIEPPVACSMKGTSSEEDRNTLPINDVPDNMEQEGGLLKSSSTDPQVDTAESGSPSHTSDLLEHVDDVHSSSSLDHCSSQAENVGIHLLPEDDHLLTPRNESDVPVACSIKGTSSEEDRNISPTNDVPDNMEQDRDLMVSVTDPLVDTAQKSGSPSHTCDLVEHVDDVHSSSSLDHCSSEAENVGIHMSSDDDNLSKPSNDIEPLVACSLNGTSFEEERNTLPATDVQDNMVQEGGLLESSFVTDSQVDTAESDRPSHTCDLVEHVDDVHSSSSLHHCSSEAENVGIHLLSDEDNLLKSSNDIEPPVACSMKGTLSEEDRNTLPINDVPDNMEQEGGQEGGLLESSSTDPQVDTAESGSPSHTSDLVEHVDDVQNSSSSLDHCSSEAENAGMHLLPEDDHLLMPGNESDAPVACSVKGTSSEEDRNMLPINDVPDNMEQEGGLLESSSTDPRVDTVESGSPSHTSDLLEHVDDVHSSSLSGHHSSEVVNMGVHLLPKHDDLLIRREESEVSLACSMEDTLSKEDHSIRATNDVPDNKEQDDGLLEMTSVADSRDDAAESGGPSQTSQLVEHVQCDVHETAIESVQFSPCTGEHANAASVAADTADPCQSTAESDNLLELSCEEIPAYESERSITETDAANREDENNDAESPHVCGMDVVSSNSVDSCREDVVLSSGSEVTSVPVSHTSAVVLVSDTGLADSTATTRDTETVGVGSQKENDESTIIVVKNASASAQPSAVSVPRSSSSVLSNLLQCITSTAADSVSSSSSGSALQFHDYTTMPAMQPKSRSTTYRPAAALAMNIGKNLVTERILHEVVAQEQKWNDASDEEQVLVRFNINNEKGVTF